MSVPVIEVRELSVSIDGRRILEGVGFALTAGEWLAVVGPNGAGKTTLLRCIAGGMPYQGSIRLAGHEAQALPRAQRARQVAVVPQHPVFPEGMLVAEYVLLGRTPHVPRFGFERRTDWIVVEALLAQLGLSALASRAITTLSGGERQRAVIARSLAQEPAVLLLDEPTTALDLGHQHEVLSLVDDLRLARGLAVISALHDLTLAGQYAERFLLLAEGRPVATGAAAEVLEADLLERCYGTPVSVIEVDGTTVVVPPRPGQRRAQPAAGL
ncbi:MAG TPA: ABC transporter ATP-binding protein [Actinomycetota bacterium]|nr:ABC transporter ATP-binding protein [Actinomycetota bacterium]